MAGYTPSLTRFRGPLIRRFLEMGIQVACTAPESDCTTIDTLATWGASFHPVPIQRSGIGLAGDLAYARGIRALCRQLQPDLAFAYTVKPVVYGLPAAEAAGTRWRVALVTGLGYAFGAETLKRRLVRLAASILYRRSLRRVSGVLFQNPDDCKFFADHRLLAPITPSLVVAGSGVDIREFAPTPIPSRGMTFLMIARLLADKGIREFVHAAHLVKRRYPDARFVIAGPFDPSPAGIQPPEVQQWTADGSVEYIGFLSDVRQAIAGCSVFVLPSYREGTPRTVLEAMAMGRPIITTDAPGCRETVEPGVNGWLVPPRDIGSLAAAMQDCLLHPEQLSVMGRQSREIATERFDVDRVNDAILHWLDSTVVNRPSATLL